MSKPTNRNQRGKGDGESRMLRLWQTAISPVDAFYGQMVESLFSAAKWAIGEKIGARAGSDGRLSSCDVRIFEYYKKLMFYYENAMELFASGMTAAKGAPGRAVEILAGMSAVVGSRLRARAEGAPGAGEGAETPNPVKAEKLMLISNHIRVFSESFDAVAYRPRSELFAELFVQTRMKFIEDLKDGRNAADGVDELFGRALSILREKGFARLYALYTQTLSTAEIALNDFYSRNAAAYYSHELMNEHEILRNLAMVQLPALELEGRHLPAHMKKAVDAVITAILGAYQALSKDVAEITEFLSSDANIKQTEQFEAFEVFESTLLDAIAKHSGTFKPTVESFDTRFEAMSETFRGELIKAVAEGNFTEKHNKPASGLARDMLDRELHLATEIKQIFADISTFYNGDPKLIADEDIFGRISKGIAETVFIKAESLNEAAEALAESVEPILAMASEDASAPDEASVAALADQTFTDMVTEMARFQKEDRRALSACKKYMNFTTGNEVYAGFAAKAQRQGTKLLDDLRSRLLKFKREQTLYEISTFEEIKIYSVSRLRESDAPHIIGFVRYIDEAEAKLTDTLKRHDITAIRPNPGDAFNGREQEILMAEPSPTFKRGQIIKLLNTGYKQAETVLLRANVIAAKD